MSDEIDLPDDVMTEAAQNLFASEWADAREAAGFSFNPGTEITEVCPDQETAKLLEMVRPYVADLASSWGMGVGEMFRLMAIDEDEWAEALYYVLMSCRGHGVGLADDYDENIEIAEAKLGRKIDPSPFNSEFTEFADLASEVVEAEAIKSDDDPDPDSTFRPGERVRVEDARLPSGDRLRGTGTVVRCVRDEEGVIVTMDEGEHVDPWSYQGKTVLVDEDDCEPLS